MKTEILLASALLVSGCIGPSSEYDKSSGEFTLPSTLKAGDTVQLSWKPDPLFDTISAVLYCGSLFLGEISEQANSGSCQWIVPDVMKNDPYTVRILDENSSTGTGLLSTPFRIVSSYQPDQYEPDSEQRPAVLTLDSVQNHTLALGDTDWVTLPVDSGVSYRIKVTSQGPVRVGITQPHQAAPRIWYLPNTEMNHLETPSTSGTIRISVTPESAQRMSSFSVSAEKNLIK